MKKSFRQAFLGNVASAVAAVALAIGGLEQAQAGGMDPSSDPAFVNAYVGVGYGFQVRTGCDGAATCEAGRDGLKIFGGYRFTPSLATEVSYYYLGKQERTWANGSAGQPTVSYINSTNAQASARVEQDEATTHVLALGLALESEMFPNIFNGRLLQHLRVGLAASTVKKTETLNSADVTTSAGKLSKNVESSKNRIFPYVGTGLSYGLSPRWRVFSSVDALINPDRKYYVVTFGGGGEF